MTRLQAAARRPTGVAALLLSLIAALLFAFPAAAQSKLDFPPLTGRVVDQANLLDPATEQALTEKLAALEASSTDQLVVVTVNSLQDQEIEDYGYQLGRAWGIGQKENDNGALLIVAPNERKVRVEVGYGLEPILTDAFSSQVIRDDILPSFRDGDYQAGVVKGVDALIAQLSLDPAEAQARAQAAAAQQADNKGESIVPIIIIAAIFFFMFLIAMRSDEGAGATSVRSFCGRRRKPCEAQDAAAVAASEAVAGLAVEAAVSAAAAPRGDGDADHGQRPRPDRRGHLDGRTTDVGRDILRRRTTGLDLCRCQPWPGRRRWRF